MLRRLGRKRKRRRMNWYEEDILRILIFIVEFMFGNVSRAKKTRNSRRTLTYGHSESKMNRKRLLSLHLHSFVMKFAAQQLQ